MSVDPPPSDWAVTRDLFAPHDPILESDPGRTIPAVPHVILEGDDQTGPSPDSGPPSTGVSFDDDGRWRSEPTTQPVSDPRPPAASQLRHPPCSYDPSPLTPRTRNRRLAVAVEDFWYELPFGLWRAGQLAAVAGLMILTSVVVVFTQRGYFTILPTSLLPTTPDEGVPAGPGLEPDANVDSGDNQLRSSPIEDDGSNLSSATGEGSADAPGDRRKGDGSKLVADKNTTGTKAIQTTTGSYEPGDVTSGGDRQLKVASVAIPEGADQDGGTATPATTSPAPTIRFETCADAVAAGAAPITLGEPGYRLSLDRDKDGVACENGAVPEPMGDAPPDSLLTATSSSTATSSTSTSDPTTTRPSTSSSHSTSSLATTTTISATSSTTSSPSTTSSTTTTPSTLSPSGSTTSTTAPSTSASTTTTRPPTTTSTSSTTTSTAPPTTATTTTTAPPSTAAPTVAPTTDPGSLTDPNPA